ncbi:MAG: hypothetical protein AUI50_05865 [Crenarchaeota archaeon 13_1_40CM_2_52_14]|nr:MAG: hypothetical protein AUI97_04050 [Crenarchaeota archaeon 13_1_40CM_3_52_17]OLD34569.1 MAG: hypothetical protein AUI50_05865 [Crenarchaeota archaeon 13_1_40CM_2_52_14]OLE69802.1 MAG: hypothetical protein AUF78_09420 [archaeon 13_1_20CM_2_51_12]
MNIRYLKLLAFVIPIIIVAAGFAATQVAFQNTSRINTGLNIFITQPSNTNPGSCPAHLNSLYVNNPTSVFWNLTQGGAPQVEFFCIDNQGSVADNPTVTSSLGPPGACPSTGNGLVFQAPSGVPPSLAANQATISPVSIGVCAGSFALIANPGPTFSVTVT